MHKLHSFMRSIGTALWAALLLTIGQVATAAADVPETILVSSQAFGHDTDMPLRYTAYGDNVSPDLSWRNLPEGTKQLALILDHPVVDTLQPFVHCIAYNIPASANGL